MEVNGQLHAPAVLPPVKELPALEIQKRIVHVKADVQCTCWICRIFVLFESEFPLVLLTVKCLSV
jgi:hypothetical protein